MTLELFGSNQFDGDLGAGWRPRARARARRGAWAIMGMFLVSVTLAACGGPSPTGVVSGSTTTSLASGDARGTALLAYSSCMRVHGVPNFPDPAGSGGIPKETAQQLGVGLPLLQAANNDCARLLPGGSPSGTNDQSITIAQQQYYLKVTTCMHSRGVATFPEPSFFAGSVEFQGLGHLPGVGSPLFTHAFDICRKFIPAELPYGSESGG